MYPHECVDWRDDAPKLRQCEHCTDYETEDAPFFLCCDCAEVLCPEHCGTKHTFYGIEMCDQCLDCSWRTDAFFCQFEPDILAKFSAITYTNIYPAGSVLYAENEPPRGLFILCSGGVKLGSYHVDFACLHAKLVIEVDGPTHDDPEQIEHDRKRDEVFTLQGIRILRLTNGDVIDHLQSAVESIELMIEEIEGGTGSSASG